MRLILFCDENGIETFDKAVGVGQLDAIVVAKNRPQAFKIIKKRKDIKGVPIFVQPFKGDKKKIKKFIGDLKNLKPDLILVNSYSMILPKEILDIPKRGAINIHGAMLPKYRGANVLNWVLINGEKETGITLHYMNEDIDAGDIIAQTKIKISFTDTASTLKRKFARTVITLLKKEWPNIINNNVRRMPQDNSIATVVHRRKPEDGLIDWSKPAIEIYNLIRALVKPYPGAYYFDKKGNKIIIDKFLPLQKVKKLQNKILKK